MSVFIDTNIAVYADDAAYPEKQAIAAALIADAYQKGEVVISTQVMQEYYNAAVNKLKIDAAIAVERLRFFARFEVVSATPQLVLAATDLHRLHSLSFWDALILQSAISSGCHTLYSEDLNHGEIIHGVKIVNPFALAKKQNKKKTPGAK
jgi:predicted nucleic acid-binding protein